MSEKYKGMTVNERLFESGLIDEFDKAVGEKDIAKMVSILKQVEFGDSNIDAILKHYKLTQ